MRQATSGDRASSVVVERLAHAVQALKLEAAVVAARISMIAGDRQRIVGGELRIDARPRGQQFARAGEIGKIGHRLAREHRIIGKAALLRALDLGVPIGALDQPHHQPAIERAASVGEPVDHGRRALLIGLHRKAEAVPAGERRVADTARDHVEREFQPVGLLGVDGEIEIVRLRQRARARARAATSSRQHAVALTIAS